MIRVWLHGIHPSSGLAYVLIINNNKVYGFAMDAARMCTRLHPLLLNHHMFQLVGRPLDRKLQSLSWSQAPPYHAHVSIL